MSRRVQVVQTLDDRDVVAAYERQLRLLDRIDRKFDDMGQTSEGATDVSVRGFIDLGDVISLATQGLQDMIQANQELIRQGDELAVQRDREGRRFRVQAGLTELEAAPLAAQRDAIGARLGLGPEFVEPAATQLVSSGFSANQASGAELQSLLEILVASNQAGEDVDPTALAKAIPLLITANNETLNDENLRRVGVGTQRLFKGTNLQLSDLPEYAKVAGSLAGKLSIEEQLATAATLSGSSPAAESATALRNLVLFLSADASAAPRAAALDELGLEAGDVDFVGEGYTDVLDRLGGALEQIPEERRDDLQRQLFGIRSVTAGSIILRDRAGIARNLGLQADVGGFQSDVDIGTGGLAAGAERGRIAIEQEKRERSEGDILTEQALEEILLEGGQSAFEVSAALRAFRFARGTGFSQETALQHARFISQILLQDLEDVGTVDITPEAVQQRVQEYQAPASQQAEVLQNIERNTRPVDPTAPPPEAALGRQAP